MKDDREGEQPPAEIPEPPPSPVDVDYPQQPADNDPTPPAKVPLTGPGTKDPKVAKASPPKAAAEAEEPGYSVKEKAAAYHAREQATRGTQSGRVFHHVGQSQAGRDHNHDNIYNNYAAPEAEVRLPVSGPIDDEHLNLLQRVHVENGDEKILFDRLRETPLLLLAGRASTGRLQAALRALDQITGQARGPSRIHLISTGTDWEDALTGLQKDQAYVLDASGAEWVIGLDHAKIWRILQSVRESNSWIIILVDEPWLVDAGLPHLVWHQPPDQAAVTLSHLALHLTEAKAKAVLQDVQEFPQVEGWPRSGGGPQAAVSLARAIERWPLDSHDPNHEIGPQPVLLHRPSTLRLARSLFRQTTERREQKGWTPRSQSLVLASAVLDGEPLDTVIRAAEGLRQRLTLVEVPNKPVGCIVFEAPLRHWLRHTDITHTEMVAGVPDPHAGGRAPGIHLNDPVLATSILEIAWKEYDLLRGPLLAWVRELCRTGNVIEHSLAAVAAGRLAVLDFDTLREQVIEPWAGSSNFRDQQSAAWALEQVVLTGDRFGQKALDLIGQWIRTPNSWRRWSGLRALGTQIARLDGGYTLKRLSEAARTGPPRQDELIQDAMVGCYLSGLEEEVVGHLHTWLHGTTPPRRRAVGTFLHLAELYTPGSNPGRQDLLTLADQHDQLSWVNDLWLFTLRQPSVERRAWRCLLRWAESASGSTEASRAFDCLRDQLEKSPDVAARLRLWDSLQRFRSIAS